MLSVTHPHQNSELGETANTVQGNEGDQAMWRRQGYDAIFLSVRKPYSALVSEAAKTHA